MYVMEAWAQQHLESPSRQATKAPPDNWQEVWRAAVPTLAVGVLRGLTSVMGPLRQCPSGLCNNVQTAKLQYASATQLRPLPYMLPARQIHVQRATSPQARGDSPQRLGGGLSGLPDIPRPAPRVLGPVALALLLHSGSYRRAPAPRAHQRRNSWLLLPPTSPRAFSSKSTLHESGPSPSSSYS